MESDNGSEQGRDEGRGPPERDMVAPGQSRALWERIDASKGPGITGKQQDWNATNFKMMSFMKDYGLDKTMKGKDPDKESDEEHKQANYKRRDGIVFSDLGFEETIDGGLVINGLRNVRCVAGRCRPDAHTWVGRGNGRRHKSCCTYVV